MASGFKINANIKEIIKNLNDIFDGGTANQVLIKTDSTDYNFDWGAVLTSAADETVSGAYTFTHVRDNTDAAITIQSNVPTLRFREDDQGTDEKEWEITGAASDLQVTTLNDSGVAGVVALNFVRGTGTAVAGITTQGNYLVEGDSDARNVIRSERLQLAPGATPGTNINVSVTTDTTGRGYNAAGLTNATNLAASGSSGSFSLNAGATTLTIDTGGTVLGVLSANVSVRDWEASSTAVYRDPYAQEASGDIALSFIRMGTSSNRPFTTLLDAGSRIDVNICYIETP